MKLHILSDLHLGQGALALPPTDADLVILAGDIAACVGLREVTTGETLCDPSAMIVLERMVFPEPVIQQAVEPKTKSDQEKMGLALNRLAAEDPSFRVRTDEESGQTIIAGRVSHFPPNHRRSGRRTCHGCKSIYTPISN